MGKNLNVVHFFYLFYIALKLCIDLYTLKHVKGHQGHLFIISDVTLIRISMYVSIFLSFAL